MDWEATRSSTCSVIGVFNDVVKTFNQRPNGGASNLVRQPITLATSSKLSGRLMANSTIASSPKTRPGARSNSRANSSRDSHRSRIMVMLNRSRTLCMPEVRRHRSDFGESVNS